MKNIFEAGELAQMRLFPYWKQLPPMIKIIKLNILETKIKAELEFDKFCVVQDQSWESDFDKEIRKLKP